MKECTIDDTKMKEIYKQIGITVAKIRKEKGLSQLQLALAIGHKAVGMISNGERCIDNRHFNIEQLIKIADILEVNIKDFFDGIEV